MKTDRPMINAERSVSYGRESCSISDCNRFFLHDANLLCVDKTPMKPSRRCSCMEGNCDTNTIIDLRIVFSTADENNGEDDVSVFSDITDPSVFDNRINSAYNDSMSTLDSPWQEDTLEESLHIENLGQLHEKGIGSDSVEFLAAEATSLSTTTSKDRSAFATSCSDRPPKAVKRLYSSFDWAEDLGVVDD